MTPDRISITEYNKQIATAGQTVRTAGAEYTNSVMTKVQTTNTNNTSENKVTKTSCSSKFEELQNLCSELGTSIENIFHYPIENLSEEKLQSIIDAIKLALKNATSNNKLNKEMAVELARKYCIAVSSGAYTVKELEDNKNKLQGESISARLERFYGLKEGSFNSLSEEEKANYIKRYFVNYFQELINKGDSKEIEKLQLRDFIKLLTNSSDDEKVLFKQVITDYLLSDNRLKGLYAAISSIINQEDRTKFVDSWTVEERAALGKVDAQGNSPKGEDITAMQAALTREGSKEGLSNIHEDLTSKVTNLLEKVKNEEELTQEEELLLKTFKSLYAGEELGLIENDVIKDSHWKQEFLKQINSDIKTHGENVYNDVLNQMAKALDENSECFNMPQEEIAKILNITTSNQYSEAVNEYIAEKENAEAQNSSIPDYGFTTRENVDTSRVIALKQQLNFTEEKTSFKIEKNTTQPEKSGNTFKEQFAVAATRKEKLNVLRVFFDNSPVLKNALEKYMASITDPLNTLNALPTNVRKYLAQKLTQKGKLNEEDIYKLNLSFNEKQLLYNILKEDEKKKQAII